MAVQTYKHLLDVAACPAMKIMADLLGVFLAYDYERLVIRMSCKSVRISSENFFRYGSRSPQRLLLTSENGQPILEALQEHPKIHSVFSMFHYEKSENRHIWTIVKNTSQTPRENVSQFATIWEEINQKE